jgi:hypothetical protein
MALALAWLDGTKAARWWLAMASRAVRSRAGVEAIAEAEGESEHEESGRGLWLCPHGTAVTGGVPSPSRHHVRCHAHAVATGASH